MIALPVDDNFLYVESIYIQADTARMPQLRKVVLAMGERLVYEDNFELALAELGYLEQEEAAEIARVAAEAADPGSAPRLPTLAERVDELKRQLQLVANELEQVVRELR